MRRFPVVMILMATMVMVCSAAGAQELPRGFERVWPAESVTDLSCLAVSEAGAIVAGGDGPTLVVSPDSGASWQRVQLPGEVTGLRALARGGGLFVAVATDGRSLTSEDGTSWTVHDQDPPLDWVEDLAWTGSGFAAVGGSCPGDCELFESSWKWAMSADGVSWGPAVWQSLYYGTWPKEVAAHGGILVATPYGDSDLMIWGVLVSTDGGQSWLKVNLGFAPDHVVATEDGFYVLDEAWVHRDGTLERKAASSSDGADWTPLDATSLGQVSVEDVAWSDGRLVAVTENGTAESQDGANWTWLDQGAPAVRPRFGKIATVSGVGLVGVGREETVLDLSGSQWNVLTTSGWPDLERIAASPDRLVAVGSSWLPGMSPLMESADGAAWQPAPAPENVHEVTDVVWTGERFVAAAGGSVLISPDGLSWQQHAVSGATMNGLWVVNGGVLGVGGGADQAGGAVLWSADGLSWEVRAQVGSGLRRVACTRDGAACVAVGLSGSAALGAPDGPWQETHPAADSSDSLEAVATNGRRWVAAGSAGMFTSADGVAWSEAKVLILDDAYVDSASDVAWAGDGFLAMDPDRLGVRPERSLDGKWWGTAARSMTGFDHVDGAAGSAWILGKGGRLARAVEAPSPEDPAAHTYLLPAVAHTAGLAGTMWWSNAYLARRGDGSPVATADLYLLTSGEEAAAASRRRVSADSAETVPVEDVMGEGFGVENLTGAVLIRSDTPLNGWSRTFTEGSQGGGYGQMIPLVSLEDLDPVQDLIGLEETDAFRTNLGLVNAGPEAVTGRVEVWGALNELLAAENVSLAPFSSSLQTHYLRRLGLQHVENAWIRVILPSTRKDSVTSCLAYASVVDNRTGDPTLVLPQRASGEDQVVPVVVHLPGYNGTLWRTDLEVVNTGAEEALFSAEYWPVAGSAMGSPELALAPGAAARYRDVVRNLLGSGDKGVLVIHPLAGAVAVRSRTYTVAPEGSYGQAIPAVQESSAGLMYGEWIGLPEENSDDAPFRVNVGVVNTSSESREVGWWDSSNPDLWEWLLPPTSLRQLNHALRGSGEAGARRTLEFSASGGPVMGYVSIVDNVTGDPVYYPAEPEW